MGRRPRPCRRSDGRWQASHGGKYVYGRSEPECWRKLLDLLDDEQAEPSGAPETVAEAIVLYQRGHPSQTARDRLAWFSDYAGERSLSEIYDAGGPHPESMLTEYLRWLKRQKVKRGKYGKAHHPGRWFLPADLGYSHSLLRFCNQRWGSVLPEMPKPEERPRAMDSPRGLSAEDLAADPRKQKPAAAHKSRRQNAGISILVPPPPSRSTAFRTELNGHSNAVRTALQTSTRSDLRASDWAPHPYWASPVCRGLPLPQRTRPLRVDPAARQSRHVLPRYQLARKLDNVLALGADLPPGDRQARHLRVRPHHRRHPNHRQFAWLRVPRHPMRTLKVRRPLRQGERNRKTCPPGPATLSRPAGAAVRARRA